MRIAKLKLKPRKCRIGYPTVDCVGHVPSRSAVSMQTNKIQRVVAMAAPVSKDGVRPFLGLAGHYRRFVKRFADLAKSLIAMLASKAVC